jgi:hypothetical protein
MRRRARKQAALPFLRLIPAARRNIPVGRKYCAEAKNEKIIDYSIVTGL